MLSYFSSTDSDSVAPRQLQLGMNTCKWVRANGSAIRLVVWVLSPESVSMKHIRPVTASANRRVLTAVMPGVWA
jgi:hypothetical protein